MCSSKENKYIVKRYIQSCVFLRFNSVWGVASSRQNPHINYINGKVLYYIIRKSLSHNPMADMCWSEVWNNIFENVLGEYYKYISKPSTCTWNYVKFSYSNKILKFRLDIQFSSKRVKRVQRHTCRTQIRMEK